MSRSSGLTFYAQARLSFVELQLAIKEQDADSILDASRKILLFDKSVTDDEARLFDPEMILSTEETVFKSLIISSRYSEALTLFDEWSDTYPKLVSAHGEVANKISSILNSESPVIVDINFRNRDYAVEHLSKQAVSLIDIPGEVKELKFR